MPAPHFPKSATLDLTGPLPWQGTTHDDVLGAKERRALVLEGLAGDDTLYGSYGDDIYIWNIGDGSDTFTEPEFGGGGDLIRFGAGITRNDLSFRVNRFSSDLLIDVASDVGVETLAISFQHSSPLMGRTIETAEFADGSTLDLTGPLPLRGTTGDDVIFFRQGRTLSLEGLAGDDTLHGGHGDDIFIWNIGDGSDNFWENGGNDLIRFGAGITQDDLSFRGSAYNLQIDVTSGAGVETLRLLYQLDDGPSNILGGRRRNPIETAEFADGSTLDLPFRVPLPLRGSTGDDTLRGSTDDDIYIWNFGDGSDTLDEVYGGGSDLIRFGAGITRSDLSFRMNNSHLYIDVTSDAGVETLTLWRQFWGYAIETAAFSDGSTLDLTLMGPPSPVPVYRFFSGSLGGHFFSVQQADRDDPPATYAEEGVGFKGRSSAQHETIPVYGYRNTTTNAYLLTANDKVEKSFLDNSASFENLGIVFHGYGNQVSSDLVPVYRYLNVDTNSHFFTASFAERAFVDRMLTDFRFEGVKFWAYSSDFEG